jgi:hypothetical protein
MTFWWRIDFVAYKGRPAQQQVFAIQFFLAIKCLLNLFLRQAMGMTQSLLKLAGLDWAVPDTEPFRTMRSRTTGFSDSKQSRLVRLCFFL